MSQAACIIHWTKTMVNKQSETVLAEAWKFMCPKTAIPLRDQQENHL